MESAPTAPQFTSRPLLRLLAGAAAVALLAAGCGGSGKSPSAGSTSPTEAASAAPSPSGGGGDAAGTTVTVTETEFKLALSQTTFRPGTYTFVADNKGQVTHALEVDGPGAHDKATGSLSSGKTGRLTVTLQKGTYELFCPVGNHKQQGMETHITVG